MFKSKKKVPQSMFSGALQQQIYREQGNHYQRLGRHDSAIEAYKKSLELNPEIIESAYRLAESQLIMVHPDEALNGLKAKFGLANYSQHVKSNLTECDCYYDLNEFEQNMLKLSQKSAALKENYHQIQLKKKNFQKITLKKQEQEIFAAQRSKPFVERFTTISKNFDETIGELAGNCLQKDPEIFQRIHEKYKKVDEKAGTSSWKEIKEKGKCDAASVHNLQFKEKHIKYTHRSDQLNKYISQVYLKRAWKDFDFIGKLMKNDVLDDSRQNEECKGKIQDALNTCHSDNLTSIKMLHTRAPIYAFKNQMFANKSDQKKYFQEILQRIRHQTLRDQLNQLEKIQKLRESRNLKNLVRYVEIVLGHYYQIKTDKEMPRKDEFVAIICQQVGRAHLDPLKLPNNLENIKKSEQLQKIFLTPSSEKVDSVAYVFGDMKTYQDPEKGDAPFIEFKRKLTYLENRLSHSTLRIERCHLYHEMAKQNLAQFKFDEVRTFGRKIIDEARKLGENNLVWHLLGVVIQIKADIMQNNKVKILEDLQTAREVVAEMEDQELAELFEKSFEIADSSL